MITLLPKKGTHRTQRTAIQASIQMMYNKITSLVNNRLSTPLLILWGIGQSCPMSGILYTLIVLNQKNYRHGFHCCSACTSGTGVRIRWWNRSVCEGLKRCGYHWWQFGAIGCGNQTHPPSGSAEQPLTNCCWVGQNSSNPLRQTLWEVAWQPIAVGVWMCVWMGEWEAKIVKRFG